MAKTPLMIQYQKIKEQYPDTVLLFRVGDFYETFSEDAKTASKVLGITLTKRANGSAGEVPLAGFPYHAVDSYLPKLVRAGYRVAICEQVEDPKKAKGIVKRDVVEVVTPGVALSDKLLDHKKNNYLLSIFIKKEIAGISFCDISTGEFFTYEVPAKSISQQIELVNPSEVLVSKAQKDFLIPLIQNLNQDIAITKVDEWLFNYDFCYELLLNHFETKNLKGFGIQNLNEGISAAGVILNYLNETQKVKLSHINKISLYNPSDYMILDFSTKRNLEITFSMNDSSKEGSLFGILDKTETAMGGRLLKKWISAPLRNIDEIKYRQNAIEDLIKNKEQRENLISIFKEIGDLERLISRICTGRANPRELVFVKTSLKQIPLIKNELENINSSTIEILSSNLNPLKDIVELIDKAINDFPPINISDGNVVKEGFNEELDELHSLSGNAKTWIAKLQSTERERTGIPSLKVNYNKVFGYYIEISNAHKDKIPPEYIRKQTLVNSERYITPELKDYEDKILNAEERIHSLEAKIFNEIRIKVAEKAYHIQNNARLIATLDCFLSFAQCAVDYNYIKPVVNEENIINIKEGRHPVVERILPHGEKFTPNDCFLDKDSEQIIVLTGPNMAGKSVFLRQVGLIVLLAQIGSFVPAKEATIGIVDKIYTRVGASDNITAGESTFLVEMQEAANILNNATDKSLILLDEIGRGTSTFDGISIAWSITEYLHENPKIQAKTIFATHYHELNEMANIFPRIVNRKVEVREYGDKVIFLHKVIKGGADHSYGIQVAQMAGLPTYVTNRAKDILASLESKGMSLLKEKKRKTSRSFDEMQFNLFEIKDDKLREELSSISVENLTPLEALNKLHELKEKLNDD